MSSERTEKQRDTMQVGQYQVSFDKAGAHMEHTSTHARYRVQAPTATNAVDLHEASQETHLCHDEQRSRESGSVSCAGRY